MQGQSGGGSGGGNNFGSIASIVGHASDQDQSGSGNTEMFSQGQFIDRKSPILRDFSSADESTVEKLPAT